MLEKVVYQKLNEFLSTPSARRATKTRNPNIFPKKISIHALREEGDDLLARHALRQNEFLSTPSARRATSFRRCYREH